MIEPLRVVRLHIRHAGSYTPAGFLLGSSKIESYVKREPRNHRFDVCERPCVVVGIKVPRALTRPLLLCPSRKDQQVQGIGGVLNSH